MIRNTRRMGKYYMVIKLNMEYYRVLCDFASCVYLCPCQREIHFQVLIWKKVVCCVLCVFVLLCICVSINKLFVNNFSLIALPGNITRMNSEIVGRAESLYDDPSSKPTDFNTFFYPS